MNTKLICIPTLTRYDLLVRLLNHLFKEQNPIYSISIVVLDNGGKLLSSEYLKNFINPDSLSKINVITPEFNLGVSRSWNFFARSYGQCIVANDDVIFTTKTIKNFIDASSNSPNTIIFENTDRVAGFSTFFINKPKEWLELGGFDEMFNPAYFEDNDCRYRLFLQDNPVVKVSLQDWFHDNSSTLVAATNSFRRMHWCLYYRNKQYYINKWGGLPHHEIYKDPFDVKHNAK